MPTVTVRQHHDGRFSVQYAEGVSPDSARFHVSPPVFDTLEEVRAWAAENGVELDESYLSEQ